MRIKTTIITIALILFSLALQAIFLPTLCEYSHNEARAYVAMIIDILIPIRLLFGPSRSDRKLYLIILLTSFVWIHLFVNAVAMFAR